MSPCQTGEKTQRQNQICHFPSSSWSFLNSSAGAASLIVLNRSAKYCKMPWTFTLSTLPHPSLLESWHLQEHVPRHARLSFFQAASNSQLETKISTAKFRGFNTKFLLCFKFRGRFTKTRHTVLMIAPGTWCLLLVYRRRCFATWRLARLPKPVISQAATAFVEDVFQCCKLLGLRWAATWQDFLGSVWLNAQIAEGELISWKHKKQSWRFTRLFFGWHLILGRNCKAVGQVLHLLLQATHFLQDLSFRASKLHMATYGQKNGNHFSDKIWNSEPPSSLLSLADGALPGPSFVQKHCKMQYKVDWTTDSNKNICQWQFWRQVFTLPTHNNTLSFAPSFAQARFFNYQKDAF